MNRRASRSAYNNNVGRNNPRQNQPSNANPAAKRPAPQRPQPAQTQRAPYDARMQNPNSQMRQRGAQNPQMQPRQRGPQPNNRPNPNLKSVNATSARPTQNPQIRNQRPVAKSAPVKKTAPKPQAQKRDWIYPEGYTPQRPPQQRRPDPRNNPQRRPQQKRKPEPAIKVKIDWARVGAVCTAIAIRFALAVILVSITLFAYFRFNFYTQPAPPNEEVSYNFVTVTGEGDDAVKTTTSILEEGYSAYDREELLISFSEVSKWLGTAQVGDIYSMRFVLGDDNVSQTVVFHNSSQDAFVNGTPIAMKTRAQFRHGEVWVPVSFINDYITGITITEKKGTVSIELNDEELSFSLSPTDPLTPVPMLEDE